MKINPRKPQNINLNQINSELTKSQQKSEELKIKKDECDVVQISSKSAQNQVAVEPDVPDKPTKGGDGFCAAWGAFWDFMFSGIDFTFFRGEPGTGGGGRTDVV